MIITLINRLDNWHCAREITRQELIKMIQAKQGITAPPPNISGGFGGSGGAGGGAGGAGSYAAGLPGSVKGPGHILWKFSWNILN